MKILSISRSRISPVYSLAITLIFNINGMHVEIIAGTAGYMIEAEKLVLTGVVRGIKILTLSSAHPAVRGASATNLLIGLLQSTLKIYSS